ncbi:MAG TPA: hypothetical protein VF913_11350 [Xanthobacteraceae bacterium]
MPSRSMPSGGRAWRGAAFALGFLLLAAQAHAQGAGPFASLSGSWSGGGTISLASGANERIRCRAVYEVGSGGRALQLSIRCASDSYNFDLAGSVVYQGGAISGTWSESSRGVNGTVSGRASGSQIQAYAQGAGFSAGLSLSTQGNRQSVVIRPTGADVTAVSITLARR